jgi:uncharacterized protein (TIGR00725 family)
VIGKGLDCPASVVRLAFQVGRHLAVLHPGAVLVCGGLGGVMDAAAHGITSAGGVAIGLLPDLGRDHRGVSREPSAHLTYAIRLGLPLLHRDIVTACASDLVVVLPGSHGTMIEGWAATDRDVALLGVGDHSGWPTAGLPFTRSGLDPAELPELAADLLGLTVGAG